MIYRLLDFTRIGKKNKKRPHFSHEIIKRKRSKLEYCASDSEDDFADSSFSDCSLENNDSDNCVDTMGNISSDSSESHQNRPVTYLGNEK